ncbi:MAG: hypothetical protein IT583_04930 [Verrucomicrobia bacterium]|nr:hypothetical protein [Verrucomicrobiota bacterium]
MDKTKLTITIENKQPVELTDFTRAFLAMAEEYKRYISKHDEDAVDGDIKLYIKEIRTGSIVADLLALAPLALPFMENSTTIIGFAGYLKSGIDFLLGKTNQNPVTEKQSYENLSAILAPVAKDNGSQIIFAPTTNGNVVFNLTLSSLEANAAQNVCEREIEKLKEPETGFHDKVLLYWYQARNDTKSQTGDRAIVESINPRSVKTIFATESIKAKMLLDENENPFKSGYVVDVAVETVGGVPKLYKITELYERIDLEE